MCHFYFCGTGCSFMTVGDAASTGAQSDTGIRSKTAQLLRLEAGTSGKPRCHVEPCTWPEGANSLSYVPCRVKCLPSECRLHMEKTNSWTVTGFLHLKRSKDLMKSIRSFHLLWSQPCSFGLLKNYSGLKVTALWSQIRGTFLGSSF